MLTVLYILWGIAISGTIGCLILFFFADFDNVILLDTLNITQLTLCIVIQIIRAVTG